MTARLDDLFSPDRLRRNWYTPWTPPSESPQLAKNAAIHAQYQQLLGLIAETFADRSAIAVLLDAINSHLASHFPLDNAEVVDDEQKHQLVDLLQQLDDLLWALSLPMGSQR